MCCTCLCKHMLVRFLNKTSRANCLVVVDFYIYVLARSTIAGSLLFETCVIQRNESDQLNAWVWEIEFLKPKHVCKIFWVQVFVPLAVKLPFTSWQWDLEKKTQRIIAYLEALSDEKACAVCYYEYVASYLSARDQQSLMMIARDCKCDFPDRKADDASSSFNMSSKKDTVGECCKASSF